ncbi:hypothetical protein PCE1_000916 [Barthelona sp. PCE]
MNTKHTETEEFREILGITSEISNILQTGLDFATLQSILELSELGANPQGVVETIKHLREVGKPQGSKTE